MATSLSGPQEGVGEPLFTGKFVDPPGEPIPDNIADPHSVGGVNVNSREAIRTGKLLSPLMYIIGNYQKEVGLEKINTRGMIQYARQLQNDLEMACDSIIEQLKFEDFIQIGAGRDILESVGRYIPLWIGLAPDSTKTLAEITVPKLISVAGMYSPEFLAMVLNSHKTAFLVIVEVILGHAICRLVDRKQNKRPIFNSRRVLFDDQAKNALITLQCALCQVKESLRDVGVKLPSQECQDFYFNRTPKKK